MTTILSLDDLHKSFGDNQVLKGVTLEVATAETVVILGASGSGKSTLLRCINFLERPTRGVIRLAGQTIGTPSEVGMPSPKQGGTLCRR